MNRLDFSARAAIAFAAGAVSALCAASAQDNFDEANVPAYTLPDPLVCEDGTAVRDVLTWQEKRRPELLQLFATQVYGRTPADRPKQMHWGVTSVDSSALGGIAVRKEVTIWFTGEKKGPQMHLLMFQPVGARPRNGWPAFLGLNFQGNASVHSDPGITPSSSFIDNVSNAQIAKNRAMEVRGKQASRWQIEKVVARGYATATAWYGDLCPDRPTGLTEAVGALFGTPAHEERRADEWGAIGIWAWGLSRAMDYLEADSEIDAHRVALHGHSRLGKTALWAGAQDERFALVISNDSGSAGAKLMKRKFGSSIGYATDLFPFWWCRNYASYRDREPDLPVDQHELIALIAPRAVHVASAVNDLRADPRGEFLSVKAAEPVFRLFGKNGLGTTAMPPADKPALGDGMAYHLRSGDHDITAYDWDQYLNSADRAFKR